MKTILSHKLTQGIAAGFILLAVYIIMYPPDIEIFKKSSEFAAHLMFGLLGLSLVLLVFNQTRLMFITMLASGLLAFYLKTASNSSMILPQTNNLPKVKIAHFNLSSFDAYDPNFKAIIDNTDCDLISFQEYTPDWNAYISKTLSKEYPYAHKMVRIDVFGMAVFSKNPLGKLDIFFYEDIPNLSFVYNNGMQDIKIISSYIAPPSLNSKTINSSDHLKVVAQKAQEQNIPTIALGDFNQVYWTNEIKTFRESTKLNNSRRNISLTSKAPYDHIFYSNLMECIKFSEVKNETQDHLGISGTFQSKSSITNPAILRSMETLQHNLN